MLKFSVALLIIVGVGLAGSLCTPQAADQPSPLENSKMLKVVVHNNFADSEQQKGGLRNISNILKSGEKATIEVVCHGAGIGLVVDGQSKHSDEVANLIKQGVRFVACENTLREKSIAKDKLLPNVETVPAGAVEVIRKQQNGYGYFKP